MDHVAAVGGFVGLGMVIGQCDGDGGGSEDGSLMW